MDVEAQVLAGAERPAHAGEGEPHPLGLEAEAGSDLVAVDVQPLGGDEEVDAAVLGGHGQPGLGAEEGLVLHADLVGPLDLYLADGALVAVAEVDAPDEVAVGVDRVRRLGLQGVDQRVGGFVVDDDGLEGPAHRGGVVGGDDGDRLALVADHVRGQHRLVGMIEAVGGAAGHVGSGQDGVDAGEGDRRADVDGPDPGRRVG